MFFTKHDAVHGIGKLNLRFSFFGLTYYLKVHAKKVQGKNWSSEQKIECKNKGFLCEFEKNGELYGGGGAQRPTPFIVSLYVFWHPAYQIVTAHITIRYLV